MLYTIIIPPYIIYKVVIAAGQILM